MEAIEYFIIGAAIGSALTFAIRDLISARRARKRVEALRAQTDLVIAQWIEEMGERQAAKEVIQ